MTGDAQPGAPARSVGAHRLHELLSAGHHVRLVHLGDAASYRHGHIPGAIHAPTVAGALAGVGEGELVVLYTPDGAPLPPAGLGGAPSSDALLALEGGLAAWVEGGGTVERW